MSTDYKPPFSSSNRIDSFRYAFEGLFYFIRTQPNAWIHAGITAAITVMGFWLRISVIEWAILALAMSVVWVAEAINTSFEAAIDLASPEIHPLAKIGKDVSAAAVLIGAAFSALVGLLILGPPLVSRVMPVIRYLFQ